MSKRPDSIDGDDSSTDLPADTEAKRQPGDPDPEPKKKKEPGPTDTSG
jgi:hypothetical protein